MRFATIIGIILIILGVLSLAVDGDTFNLSPQNKIQEEEENVISPVFGIIVLAGGIILVVFGSRRRKKPPDN